MHNAGTFERRGMYSKLSGYSRHPNHRLVAEDTATLDPTLDDHGQDFPTPSQWLGSRHSGSAERGLRNTLVH